MRKVKHENTWRKHREIRDIYKKLRKKYRTDVILQFLSLNYFVTMDGAMKCVTYADGKEVENPSIIYLTAMHDDFKL